MKYILIILAALTINQAVAQDSETVNLPLSVGRLYCNIAVPYCDPDLYQPVHQVAKIELKNRQQGYLEGEYSSQVDVNGQVFGVNIGILKILAHPTPHYTITLRTFAPNDSKYTQATLKWVNNPLKTDRLILDSNTIDLNGKRYSIELGMNNP